MGRKIMSVACLIYEGLPAFYKATTRQIPVYEDAGGAQYHAGNGADIPVRVRYSSNLPVFVLRKMARDKSGAHCPL